MGDTNTGALSVPAVIKDKPVTELGKNLFAGANFHTVNLPSSVAVIGDGVDNVDTKIEVTILSGANYATVVNPEEGSTTLTSTVTFNRAIDDYVNVQVYCSATSTIVEFNFRVN